RFPLPFSPRRPRGRRNECDPERRGTSAACRRRAGARPTPGLVDTNGAIFPAAAEYGQKHHLRGETAAAARCLSWLRFQEEAHAAIRFHRAAGRHAAPGLRSEFWTVHPEPAHESIDTFVEQAIE